MIDPQAYRVAIGMFRVRIRAKQVTDNLKCDHDANAMGIALICTLLVIGGLELNPGPTTRNYYEQPGPSFIDASLMDVMQAIRLIHLNLDQLSMQVRSLSSQVNALVLAQQTSQCERRHEETSINRTDVSNDHQNSVQVRSPDCHRIDTEMTPNIEHQNTRSPKSKPRQYGAILIGSENVHRIRAAAMEEFDIDSNASFITASNDNVKQRLSDSMTKSRAQKIDVVLNTGADQLLDKSADSVLESIASQISFAKQKRKTNQVFVCSVEERQDAGLMATETAKTVNQELTGLCLEYGAVFLDLRPRMSHCRFYGLNKTGRLLTFEAARNVAQEILSEVPGFLD